MARGRLFRVKHALSRTLVSAALRQGVEPMRRIAAGVREAGVIAAVAELAAVVVEIAAEAVAAHA